MSVIYFIDPGKSVFFNAKYKVIYTYGFPFQNFFLDLFNAVDSWIRKIKRYHGYSMIKSIAMDNSIDNCALHFFRESLYSVL